jgi:hypothetical protein
VCCDTDKCRGKCGGVGCNSFGVTPDELCCSGQIKKTGVLCADTGGVPPCIVDGPDTPTPTPGPTPGEQQCVDKGGVVSSSGTSCCPAACGTCGGAGCGGRGDGCCSNAIADAGDTCNDVDPPCLVVNEPAASDPTCATGLQNNLVCCDGGCAQCGGVGCGGSSGDPLLGSAECCTGPIAAADVSCDSNLPPCVITPPPTAGRRLLNALLKPFRADDEEQ